MLEFHHDRIPGRWPQRNGIPPNALSYLTDAPKVAFPLALAALDIGEVRAQIDGHDDGEPESVRDISLLIRLFAGDDAEAVPPFIGPGAGHHRDAELLEVEIPSGCGSSGPRSRSGSCS